MHLSVKVFYKLEIIIESIGVNCGKKSIFRKPD